MMVAQDIPAIIPEALPAPEPPPSSLSATRDEINWTQEIIDNISHNDEVTCKPTIAKVIFDQTQPASKLAAHIKNCTDNIPISFCDTHDTVLDLRHLDNLYGKSDEDTSMFGELLTGEEMDMQNIINDPILNILKKTQSYTPTRWQPNLNTVIEETVYDLDIVNGMSQLKPPALYNGK
jgi:hypothetical protein